MLLFEITILFDKQVQKLAEQYNVPYRFFKEHEARPRALKNLCEQVLIQEKKVGVRLDKGRRDKIIEMAAMLFMDLTIKQRHQALKSSAEKQRLRDEARPKDEKAKEILGDAVQEIETEVIDSGQTTH